MGRTPRSSRGQVRFGRWLALAFVGLLLFAAPASATFHLIKVREVYPAGTSSYVELQMLENGEYQVGGHHLVVYDSSGTITDDFTLPSNVSATSRTNAMILITGPDYGTAFPSGPSSNEADPDLNLDAAGGAVCWFEGEPPDCVAWGDFTGPFPAHEPPLVAGNPVSPGGVTAGKAIQRSIAPNCATALEGADDSDDSATDFSEQTPHPRNNASPITETSCVTAEMQIDSKPTNPTKSTSAEFVFHSTPAGAELECKLDSGPFVECASESGEPYEYTGLTDGSHTFQTRATNSQGTGAPASYTWIVDTQAPTASIKTSPASGSSGAGVAFTYASDQLSSTFECSLAKQGQGDSFASCPNVGQTYNGLADGNYVFKVRATDKAGNQGSAVAYSWEVNNAAVVTPPVIPPVVLIPPVTIPRPAPAPTTLKCKKGFVKKKVGGKTRCVKVKKKRKKH